MTAVARQSWNGTADPKANTALMHEVFTGIRVAVADHLRRLDGLPATPKVAEMKDCFLCLEIALSFYEEANRAVQANAWFAAASYQVLY
jgi:hypothetical protein